MPPEPSTSMPSSRSGASARPISRWWRAPELRLHRELRDGNVGVGIHPAQRHPAAVVDAAVRVDRRRLARGGQQLRHALRERRRAGRLVAHAVELLGEARRNRGSSRAARAARHGGEGRVPVGRHHEDGFGPPEHDAAARAQLWVKKLLAIASVGAPWERKRAGSVMASAARRRRRARGAHPPRRGTRSRRRRIRRSRGSRGGGCRRWPRSRRRR